MKIDIFAIDDDIDFGCDDACYQVYDYDYEQCQADCQDYYGYLGTFTAILCIFHVILTLCIFGFLIRSVCMKWKVALFSWILLILILVLQTSTALAFLTPIDAWDYIARTTALEGFNMTLFTSISFLLVF